MRVKQYSLLVFTICIIFSSNFYGQGLGGNNGRIKDDFKFLPIPYINYSRSIGFQLGALPMAQFNPVSKDTLSPSSLAGLFGMYSTNETDFFMGFAKLYLTVITGGSRLAEVLVRSISSFILMILLTVGFLTIQKWISFTLKHKGKFIKRFILD